MKRTSMYKQYDDNDPLIPYGKCRKCKSRLDQRIIYTCKECGADGLTFIGWLILLDIIGWIFKFYFGLDI